MAPSPRNRFNMNNHQSDEIISHGVGSSSSSSSPNGANTISHNQSNGSSSSLSTGAIVGIVIGGVAGILLAVAAFVVIRSRRRSRTGGAYRPANARGGFFNTRREAPIGEKPEDIKPEGEGEHAADEGLLRHADTPAIVAWDADEEDDLQNARGTRDGVAHAHPHARARTGIQRPASVASFSSLSTAAAGFAPPPPRYEEAMSSGPGARASTSTRRNSDGGLAPLMLGRADEDDDDDDDEIGGGGRRSTSRGRSLGTNTDDLGAGGSARPRSVNGDRRRSVSRFREEGMVDLNLSSNLRG
ncbi:hypothetical protein PV08_06433 [Exophiala spinifera]|uniref:Uncharacterized protein n=1 Tax=Exophiala spinifera TaxID=91928 RepID=A0A0D1ZUC0_9EURO|nr:uncharacterized protein PV08_06433 [Exophiala spinifera]KIW16382.1 hypothetical protein PV08_06433 [Exophiala spinifera]